MKIQNKKYRERGGGGGGERGFGSRVDLNEELIFLNLFVQFWLVVEYKLSRCL